MVQLQLSFSSLVSSNSRYYLAVIALSLEPELEKGVVETDYITFHIDEVSLNQRFLDCLDVGRRFKSIFLDDILAAEAICYTIGHRTQEIQLEFGELLDFTLKEDFVLFQQVIYGLIDVATGYGIA